MKCQICNRECSEYKGLGSHIAKLHKISSQAYYDTYISQTNTHLCVVCGNPTQFQNLQNGYLLHCSNKCAQIDPVTLDKKHNTNLIKYGNPTYNNREKAIKTMKSIYGVENISQTNGFCDRVKQTKLEKYGDANYNNRQQAVKTCLDLYNVTNPYQIDEIKEKAQEHNYNIKTYQKRADTRHIDLDNYEIEHNCTRYIKIIELYGQGWLNIKDTLDTLYYKGSAFIPNNQISIIKEYYDNQTHGTSRKEQFIYDSIIDNYNGEVIRRCKSIISPYEIDIFLPELSIGIEFNGNYWHSIESGLPKNYHLMKSLMCRDKNIRLVHIYEFEDLEKQVNMVINLIKGIDMFPQMDFNKNNLINTNPKEEIIYQDRFTIYGASKLY